MWPSPANFTLHPPIIVQRNAQLTPTTIPTLNNRGSQFAIFQEGTFTPFLMFSGYVYPLFINSEGITLCSKLPALPQAMSEDSTSYFECGIWILTVECNAHSFSQHYNFQNQKITMLENIGYITELTARHSYQDHMSGTCV